MGWLENHEEAGPRGADSLAFPGHMTRRAKVKEYALKHGLTLKAWALAVFILPPAAIVLPFMIPGLSRPVRFALSAVTIVTNVLLTIGGLALITTGVLAIWHRLFG